MFLFVSDLHLQRTAWKAREELFGDAFRAWDQVVDYAVKNQATAVVLGGDNFDEPRPCSEVVMHFKQGMEKLKAEGISVYFVQGQHCRATPPWPALFGGMHLYTDQLVFIDGLKVFGLDNMPAQELEMALATVPNSVQVLVLHQLCKGAPCVNWDFDPEWLKFKKLELVLMGDLHVAWESKGRPKIAYGGSCAMQSADEASGKGFIRVDVVDGKVTTQRVPLKSRQKFEYLIESENALVRADQDLRAIEVKDLAPLIVVTHSSGIPVAKLREAHKDKVFMFRPLALMAPAPANTEVAPAVVSLEKNLDLVVSREEKPELHSFLLAALTAEDAKAVVEQKCLS